MMNEIITRITKYYELFVERLIFKKKIAGFTLIELLVVIAIIGALSALAMPNFMAVREKARDTDRKSDLKHIQTALELYRQDQANSAYPTALPTPGNCWTSQGQAVVCPDGAVYIKDFPKDPNRDLQSPTPDNIGYYYVRTSAYEYSLCSCLENKADPSGTGTDSGNCEATSYVCNSGWKYEISEP